MTVKSSLILVRQYFADCDRDRTEKMLMPQSVKKGVVPISNNDTYAMLKHRTGFIDDVLNELTVEVQNDVFGVALAMFRDDVTRSMPTELHHQIKKLQEAAAASNNEKLFDHLLRVVLGWEKNRNVMVYGRTQTGKTSVKALLTVICQCWKVPVVIVTTQCAEARELSTKLRQWLGNGEHNVYCAAHCTTKTDQTALIRQSIADHGVLVLASTSSTQRAETSKILRQYQNKAPWPGARTFALVLDESDALCRSDKGALAKQVVQIQKLKPCISVCMTATPFPSWLLAMDNNERVFANFCLPPCRDQYVSLEEMVPFQNEKKEPVFLPRDGLDQGGIFTFNCTKSLLHLTHNAEQDKGLFAGTEGMESRCKKWSQQAMEVGTTYKIPYCTEDVVKFYMSAVRHSKGGVLVLDCMVPWVNVEDSSVFVKASLVQNLLATAATGKTRFHIAAIVSTGDGVSYRLPGQATFWRCSKRVLLGRVIEQMDQTLGLTVPIIVFAYRKLNRSVSARSSRRFPTHLCVYKGKGRQNNLEDFIQTLGRATGNGRAVLTANGVSHVTLLTTENDWTMAQAGVALADRVARGTLSLEQILMSSNHHHHRRYHASTSMISNEEAEYIRICQRW
jgi:hypothetical protein